MRRSDQEEQAENNAVNQIVELRCHRADLPNVPIIGTDGWRGSCPAGDVPEACVGSGSWFGFLTQYEPEEARKETYR